jgi:two-component system response regulator MprA
VDFVRRGLLQSGFEVEVAYSGQQALEALRSASPDLVVPDLILPDMDGLDVCAQVRESGNGVGIVMLTARHLVGERVRGLEAGADDYMPKPFAFDELLARIRAVLRRRGHRAEGIIWVGDLQVNVDRREVRRGGRLVDLTYREFELLRLLAQNADRPLSREAILRQVWGHNYEGETELVKVYISYLRRKLSQAGETDLLHTLRCFGYVLRKPHSE